MINMIIVVYTCFIFILQCPFPIPPSLSLSSPLCPSLCHPPSLSLSSPLSSIYLYLFYFCFTVSLSCPSFFISLLFPLSISCPPSSIYLYLFYFCFTMFLSCPPFSVPFLSPLSLSCPPPLYICTCFIFVLQCDIFLYRNMSDII